MAPDIDADVLLVCKPRLPSLGLGIAAKALKNRPLILDIDDYELGFFGQRSQPFSGRRSSRDFLSPYGEHWTRYCDTLIDGADSTTVASLELQQKYGGTLVPHMRDETAFDLDRFDRDSIRKEFGYGPEDRVILFIGTPRHHKGLLEIVDALEAIGNPKYRLCMIGSVTEPDLQRELATMGRRVRIDMFPDSKFSDLPRNLSIGDLICILQQPDSVISQYQMPAKFSDALAMGIPVLATEAPPLQYLARKQLVETLAGATIAQRIEQIFQNYPAYKRRANHNREVFLREYSYAANRPKLSGIIDDLLSAPIAPCPPKFLDLLDLHHNTFGDGITRTKRTHERRRDPLDPATALAPPTKRKAQSPVRSGFPKDIVFFWKQNDSGLYGRRQEMLVRYLAQDPRIRKVLHFEPPMDVGVLFGHLDLRRGRMYRHNRFVFRHTVLRLLGLKNTAKVKAKTFVYASSNSLAGRVARLCFPNEKKYARFVERQMKRHGVSADDALFWVCPTDERFPEIAKQFDPSFIISDLIDDNRKWPVGTAFRQVLQDNYETILGASDLVLANNENLRRSMSDIRHDIHVIPNGVDTALLAERRHKRPKSLARLKGPILGYVGNLDSRRVDVSLLKFLAVERPSWQIVLIGSTHSNNDALLLSRHSNVHFMGVIPYSRVARYAAHFDVAIVPHLDNELTRHMHPLKLFLYLALKLPIVATNIRNLGLLGDFVQTAPDKRQFLRSVEQQLRNPIQPTDGDYARKVEEESWQRRVETIMSLVDATIGGEPKGLGRSLGREP